MAIKQTSVNFNENTPAQVSLGGTGAASFGTGLLACNGASAFTTAALSSGQIFFGNVSNQVAAGVISAGTGISVATGPSGFTVSSTAFTQINRILYDTPGSFTYTPTAGMKYCVVECYGGGGGGAGINASGANFTGASGSGGAGGYSSSVFFAAYVGSSKPLVVGASGAGGGAGIGGGVAGESNFNSTDVKAGGGSGGVAAVTLDASTAGTAYAAGGVGGDATFGQIRIPGQNGGYGQTTTTSNLAAYITIPSKGGDSHGGFGGSYDDVVGNFRRNAVGYGGGGVGSICLPSAVYTSSGGIGSNGAVIITEFI